MIWCWIWTMEFQIPQLLTYFNFCKRMLMITVLMMLPMMNVMQSRMIAMLVNQLILPFAILSVAVFWYSWIIEKLNLNLTTLYTRTKRRKEERGHKRMCPVPPTFLLFGTFSCKKNKAYWLSLNGQNIPCQARGKHSS